jgi:phosphoribosyl-AMP cyclohydrolase
VDPAALTYDERGLLPAVVQDADSREVLMLAWVDAEALKRTLDSGTTWFWSRSRQEYWNKGATSGNTQRVADVRYDCDSDSVLMLVHPEGPACHTGETSCFYRSFSE